MAQNNKTCKFCHQLGHSQFYCKKKPNAMISQRGKIAKKWTETRMEWFQNNASSDGLYFCFYCGIPMSMEQTTIDHLKNRSGNPSLRFNHDNLVACCGMDNARKGSRSFESYCAQYYPHLLDKE